MVIVAIASASAIWTIRRPVTFTIVRVERSSDLRSTDRQASAAYGPGDVYAVTVAADDTRAIAWREIYLHIHFFDCATPDNSYPAEATVGRDALNFARIASAARSRQDVVSTGTIPTAIAEDMKIGCVSLRGASYLFGSGRSAPARLPA